MLQSTLFSFRMNDTIPVTYSITSLHLIIKAGEASVHCTIFMDSGFRFPVSRQRDCLTPDPDPIDIHAFRVVKITP